jgi:hypothetical protein
MSTKIVFSFCRTAVPMLVCLVCPVKFVLGQVPMVPPNPQAPTLNPPVPLGIQRGTSLDLLLTGKNLAEPTGLWTSFPAQVTIPTDHNNGKDANQLRVHLDVPHDAALGFHHICLATTQGLSNFRLFCIDDLPQHLEKNTNRSKHTPQLVPIPCVVVGRADQEQAAYYQIHVQAGQRVSFEVLGRRLGSAFDPQISLYDPHKSLDLPLAHNNDAPGLQTDCRLTYVFKAAGEYVVEIRDTMWRGGGDFWYRLRIGDFPCATTALPMAARRGSQVQILFAGPVVDSVSPVEVVVPNDPGVDTVWIAPRGANGLYGWPVALALSDHEELQEQEPNNDPAHANRLPVPGGITGRFLEPNDVDCFVFAARKGQRLILEAHTTELYSPTDVYMSLKDAKGGQLAASNPMAAARLDFTAPADGDYTLAVEHLWYASGPAESYRITATPYEPGFELTLGGTRFDVPPGGSIPIGVFATRHDYAGPIDVSVVGSPELNGSVTIPAGQPSAPNQPAATLYLSARREAPSGPYEIKLRGSAVINGKTVIHDLSLRSLVIQELAGLAYPPRQLLPRVGVAVLEKPPFTLAAHLDHPEVARATPATVTLVATRAPGFVEQIALEPVGLPANVAPALKSIPKGQSEVKVTLTPAVNAALGTFPISFNGKAKFQNREHAVNASPLLLTIGLPFELHVESAPVKLVAGGKVKIKVTAMRKGGYQGPITLELRNLPAQVTAAKTAITSGQSATELELAAAGNAALGEKGGIQVVGTATAAANQQTLSPGFGLSVVKK